MLFSIKLGCHKRGQYFIRWHACDTIFIRWPRVANFFKTYPRILTSPSEEWGILRYLFYKKCSVENAIQFKVYTCEYEKLVMKLIDMSVVQSFDKCIYTLIKEFDNSEKYVYRNVYYFINYYYYQKYRYLDYFKKYIYFVITNWKMKEIYKMI